MRVRFRSREAPAAPSRAAFDASRALIPQVLGRSLRGDGAALRRAARERLGVAADDTVLELGCGDGRLLLELIGDARRGTVVGLEPDPWMVRHAIGRTRPLIESGRVRVLRGNSADLSGLPQACFDKVCAIDVVYFWQEPVRDLREILRVTKPGGRLLLGYVSAGASPSRHTAALVRASADVERWLREAGWDEIGTWHTRSTTQDDVLSWTHGVRAHADASERAHD